MTIPPAHPLAGPALHITFVGTSLLTNAGWQPGKPLPSKAALRDRISRSGRRASAELNGLLPMRDAGLVGRVHLLATDTPECLLARDVIGSHLRDIDIPTETGAEHDLLPGGGEQSHIDAALSRLRSNISRLLGARSEPVCLNITGGLKIQVALAATIAAECGVPCYYQFEADAEPVWLPPAAAAADLAAVETLCPSTVPYVRVLPGQVREAEALERRGLIDVQRGPDGAPTTIRPSAYYRMITRSPINPGDAAEAMA